MLIAYADGAGVPRRCGCQAGSRCLRRERERLRHCQHQDRRCVMRLPSQMRLLNRRRDNPSRGPGLTMLLLLRRDADVRRRRVHHRHSVEVLPVEGARVPRDEPSVRCPKGEAGREAWDQFVGAWLTPPPSNRLCSYEDVQYPVNYCAVLVNPGKNSITVRLCLVGSASLSAQDRPGRCLKDATLSLTPGFAGVRHPGVLPPVPAAAARSPVLDRGHPV